MITIRRSNDRGRSDLGWLDSRHTFSFSDYFDPDQMGFGVLRVINEDRVQPGKGFGTHPHVDMEIISCVLDGALQHKDSMGTGSVIRPGDVQRMSAGTGVMHSEFNASKTDPVHFLQIWVLPERAGLAPSYEQRSFPAERRRGRLCLVASRDGREESVSMNQDVDLFAATLAPGAASAHELRPGRRAWLQVIGGVVSVQEDGGTERLGTGDGAGISGVKRLTIRAQEETEILLFDLP